MKIAELLEAVPEELGKKYVAAYKPGNFNDPIFRGYNAPILPANADTGIPDNLPHKNSELTRIYLPIPALNTSEIKIPPQLDNALNNIGFFVVNYLTGTAKKKEDNSSREFSIGKILNKLITKNKNSTMVDFYKNLKQKFDNDPVRQSYLRPKMIVISRDPLDIAGMSYDRGWTSCMRLTDGLYKKYVIQDVRHGSLIAYLTDLDDIKIDDPVARVLIKPYLNEKNKKEVIMVPEEQIYGTAPKNFRELVSNWVEENYNKGKTDGLYCIKKALYVDSSRNIIHKKQE